MIEGSMYGLPGVLDVGEVGNPAELGIELAADGEFDFE